MEQARGAHPPTEPAAVVDAVVNEISGGTVSAQSFERLVDLMERFVRFVDHGRGDADLRQVTEEVVRQFVSADDTTGNPPGLSVMHLRRCAVRLLFRVARELGAVDTDPTIDIKLPKRNGAAPRPLTDEEVALCRAMSVDHLQATKLPAAWALAEAGIRTGEMAAVTVDDLDLSSGRVWTAGCRSALPRWAELTDWGAIHLRRRLDHLPDSGDQPLVYGSDGSAKSRQAASCIAVSMTLARAGLGDDPEIRPMSVVAWAGRKVLERTGRIEDVAVALGMRSLDRAARLIGHDWTSGGC